MERMRGFFWGGMEAALWHKADRNASCCSMSKEQGRKNKEMYGRGNKDKNDKEGRQIQKATMLVLRIAAKEFSYLLV